MEAEDRAFRAANDYPGKIQARRELDGVLLSLVLHPEHTQAPRRQFLTSLAVRCCWCQVTVILFDRLPVDLAGGTDLLVEGGQREARPSSGLVF